MLDSIYKNYMSFIETLLTKPLFAGITGATATLLTVLHVVTPILGFVSVCIAIVAGIYSLVHNRNQVLEDEQKKGASKN